MTRAAALAVLVATATAAKAELGGVFRGADPLGAGAFRLTLPAQYGGGRDFDFGGAHRLLLGGVAAYGLNPRTDVFLHAGYEFDDSVPILKAGVQVGLGDSGAGPGPSLALRGYGYVADFEAPDLAALGATALVSWRPAATPWLSPYAGLGFDTPLGGDDEPRLRDGDLDPVVLLGVLARPRPGVELNIEGVHIGEPLIGAAIALTF